MVEFGRISDSPGFQGDVVMRNMDLYMSLGMDAKVGLGESREEQEVVGLGNSCQDMDIFSKNFRQDGDGERSFEISGMMESLSLPSDLMSFALTYDKAYSSSLFMGSYWTAETTLPKIDMPIRTRPQRSKPKFECLTCKVRRVKCDELKPTCLRCQKMGLKCGGYHIPPRESTRNHPAMTRRRMLPKLILLHPQSLPEITLFHTDREYQYFKVFSEKALRDGGHRVLLQMCQTEPLIRRAIIGLAALEKMRTALDISEDAGGKTTNTLSLDSAQVESCNDVRDERNVDIVRHIERSRRQLLTYLCLIYRKRISSSHDSESSNARLEAISVLLDGWTNLIDRDRSWASNTVAKAMAN